MEDAFCLRTPVVVSEVLVAAVEPDEPAAELRVELMSGVVAQIQAGENTQGWLTQV